MAKRNGGVEVVIALLLATPVACGDTGHGIRSTTQVDADPAREAGGTDLGSSAPDAPLPVDIAPDSRTPDIASPIDVALDGGGIDAGRDTSAIDVGRDAGIDAPPLAPGAAIMAIALPSPRHEAAVFSDGQVVYAAGGLDRNNKLLSQIVRYDPSAAELTVLSDTLPTPTYAAGVAWTGSAAYVFGGLGSSGVLRQIVRYVPGAGATIMTAQLPKAAYNVAAVAAGSTIYVIGGQNGGSLTQILAYDTVTDTLTVSATTLSVGVEAASLFWDGRRVWILGGKINTTSTAASGTDAIVTFEPATGQLRSVGRLPYKVWDAPSFADGKAYYVAAGSTGTTTGNMTIVGFDPISEASRLLPFELPVRLSGHVGTWVSSVGAAFVLGGVDYSTGVASDRIIRIVP